MQAFARALERTFTAENWPGRADNPLVGFVALIDAHLGFCWKIVFDPDNFGGRWLGCIGQGRGIGVLARDERAIAAQTWRVNVASLMERRTGPRKITLGPSVAPYSRYEARHRGRVAGPLHDRFIRSHPDPGPGLYRRAEFRAGLTRLTALGLSLDAWLFHPQLADVIDLARAGDGSR